MEKKQREEMEKKGNFFNFIEDANNDPVLQQEMRDWAKKADLDGKKLMDEFHHKGYLGVSLRDCNMIVDILKTSQGKEGHWSY